MRFAATEAEIKEMQPIMQDLLKKVPDFKGRISPQESVEMVMKVVDSWTVEDSGAFVSHFGNREKWL